MNLLRALSTQQSSNCLLVVPGFLLLIWHAPALCWKLVSMHVRESQLQSKPCDFWFLCVRRVVINVVLIDHPLPVLNKEDIGSAPFSQYLQASWTFAA